MNLSKAVEGYIVHKRSLGMAFRSEAVRLHAFVKEPLHKSATGVIVE
jgi:hypothetical protein